jgi:hypothetical protein
MKGESLTPHAVVRLAQRGIRATHLDLIKLIGTEVTDGYLVREKDCQAFESDLKRLMEHIHRLRGKRVVVADDRVVTAYHARRSTERRLLRSSRP